MIPLRAAEYREDSAPDFPIPRLMADVHFEPDSAVLPFAVTYFQAAIVDTGSPFVIIPHRVHFQRHLRIRQDFGRKPYRVLSATGDFLSQSFVEVGIHFTVRRPDGRLAFEPALFVPVKAYLLEAGVRPTGRVILGLETLYDNFVLHLDKPDAFLQVRGQP